MNLISRYIPSSTALATVTLALLAFTAPVAQANLLTNGSFETLQSALPGNDYCYLGTTCSSTQLTGWSGNVPVMTSNNGPWGVPSALAGWNAGLGQQQIGLQGSNSVLSQFVTLAQPSTIALSWFDAGRSNYSGTQQYTVSFGGIDLGTFTTNASQGWAQQSLNFNATGSGALQFRSLNIGNYDRTSFIDNVALTARVSAVPEPQSLALVLAGLAVLPAVMRRRKPA